MLLESNTLVCEKNSDFKLHYVEAYICEHKGDGVYEAKHYDRLDEEFLFTSSSYEDIKETIESYCEKHALDYDNQTLYFDWRERKSAVIEFDTSTSGTYCVTEYGDDAGTNDTFLYVNNKLTTDYDEVYTV